jgi:hypothetical protein
MVKDSEKGIGYLIGYEEPDTAEKRKAYYRELIRQKVEGPRAAVPEPDVTVLSGPIDITKYNGPRTKDLGHTKMQQRKDFVKERTVELKKQKDNTRYLARSSNKDNPYNLKFPYNKVTGRIENQEGEKVESTKAVKEQQLLDRRIDGAKVLQYVSDNNTMYADQPRAYWQWDGVKQDYVDINKGKTKKPIHQQLSDLKNWEQKNKEKSLSKIVKTPIGDMKIINTNQKDIANKQPRKKYESL